MYRWIAAPKRGSWAVVIVSLLVATGALAQSDSVTLAWFPNEEPDLAGYIVYYGTYSGRYDHVLDVGNQTQARVRGLESGTRYYFVVTAYDRYGNESPPSQEVSGVVGASENVPDFLFLVGNYPNPFTEDTRLEFNMPQRGVARVEVVDLLGRRVRTILDRTLLAGRQTVVWDARNDAGTPVPSGVYFIVARSRGELAARQVLLLRNAVGNR